MPSTRSRVALLVAAVAAVLLLGVLGRAWFSTDPEQTIFAGTYTSDTDLRVTNLTITGGHVRVGYALDVLYAPSLSTTVPSSSLRCGLVDTSGQLDFFAGSSTIAPAGEWTHLEFASNYDLPDITLGVRCSPSADGAASVTFRNIGITAEKM